MPLLLGIALYALYIEYKPIQQCPTPKWEKKPANPTGRKIRTLEKAVASYLEREDVRNTLREAAENFNQKERRFIESGRVKGVLLDESRQTELHKRLDKKIRATLGEAELESFFHYYMSGRD